MMLPSSADQRKLPPAKTRSPAASRRARWAVVTWRLRSSFRSVSASSRVVITRSGAMWSRQHASPSSRRSTSSVPPRLDAAHSSRMTSAFRSSLVADSIPAPQKYRLRRDSLEANQGSRGAGARIAQSDSNRLRIAAQVSRPDVVLSVKKGRRDTVLARVAPGLWIRRAGGAGSYGLLPAPSPASRPESWYGAPRSVAALAFRSSPRLTDERLGSTPRGERPPHGGRSYASQPVSPRAYLM